MKEKILKPPRKAKERYALKAFLWGAVIAAAFVIPCMFLDKGMYLYYGDYNYQVIPFYQLMVDSIHSGNTGWSWYTDLGSSFVGSYTFYNLGSPFFWILLLFPSKAVPYVLGPLTVFKFGVSSFTAYIFLKRYTKNKNNAVIGAVLYAFSGAAMYNLVFHFIDAMALFPLLPAALDSYIYDNKRGRFAAVVFLCAMTNYYLFIAEVVFMLLYWAVRMITRSYKIDSRRVLYLFFEAVLGVCMAMFILLPTIYHVIGNNRMSASNMNGWGLWAYDPTYFYINIFLSFFMPPELPQISVYITGSELAWTSNTAYLPLFGMSGVFAIIQNKYRNKWLRVFYAVCTVMLFIPVLNSSFQMFKNFIYLRWLFMLLLIMSMGSVMALEDTSTKWKEAITTNLIITGLLVVIIGFTPSSTETDGMKKILIGIFNSYEFWIFSAVAIGNIAMLTVFIYLYKNKRQYCMRYTSLILAVTILTTLSAVFVEDKYHAHNNADPVRSRHLGVEADMGLDDLQNWRTDALTSDEYSSIPFDDDHMATMDYAEIYEKDGTYVKETQKPGREHVYVVEENVTLFWKIPGFCHFHSTVNSSITRFYESMGINRETVSVIPMGMYGLRSLLSVKYVLNHTDNSLSFRDSDDQPIFPGYKLKTTWNTYDVFENEYVIPPATTFDRFMLNTEFQTIPVEYRHLVMLDTLIIESIDDMYEMTALGMEQSHPEDYDYTQEEYFKNCEARRSAGGYDYERDNKGFDIKIKNGDEERYAFIAVPYDAGWKATVNGEPADIKLVDFGFMAVKVPANTESTVRFNYHTQGSIYGAFVSIVGLFMLLIYLAVVKVRRANEEITASQGAAATAPGFAEKIVTGSKHDGEIKPDGEVKPDGEITPENADEHQGETKAENKGSSDGEPAENKQDSAADTGEELDDMSVFEIIRQTEEQTMMHVYKRVPVVLERGAGAVGYDIDDKKYIDFTSGIGVNALGFADGRWIDAVQKQLLSVQHTSNLYYNTTQISLAEMLCMKTGFSKVFFANSGAEANECAIKVARKYGSDRFGEKHTHIITLENSFHGRTITTLAATGQDVFHKYFTPFTEGFSFAKANDMDSIRECTTEDTCAVMIELIQGEGGVNPLDREFVTELAAYCKEKGLLLVVDEIQTGVGRTGKLYCYENYGIQPDVVTTAKALGGGLPLSACMCTEELKDVLTPGTNGTTFGGNPIACAGAMKILDIVGDEEFLAEVRAKGEYMRGRIEKMKGVKEVRGMGLMIGIVLEKDNAGDVLTKCAENGLLVLTAKNLVRLLPPLSIEYEDIDEGLDILEKSIAQTLED